MTAMASGRTVTEALARLARWTALGLGLAALAACQGSRQQTGGPAGPTGPLPAIGAPTALATPDAFGDGVTTVAILAPLTGADAAIGQQLVNAAQMAAVERGGQNFVLIAKDTQGTPTGAAAAAQQAILERADIIIGPLRSQNVAAVAPIAAQAGINVVAFTTDATVAGPNAFVLGLTPEGEVERILSYAARQGSSVIAALVPQTAYGSVAANALQAIAPRVGLAVGPIQVYNPTDSDHTPAVQSLQSGGFDTLFVPGRRGQPGPGDAVRRLLQRRPRPAGAGHRPVAGREHADRPVDQRRAVRHASTRPCATPSFAKYQSAYGTAPSLVAGLAYDAAAMAAELGRANNFSGAAIANQNGFGGVYGAYRFGADSVADHALAVLQVANGGFVVIDPAPTSFVGF
ncbi:MAG: penicillin-binding protein activator [Alphaproteobacteria bacterium]